MTDRRSGRSFGLDEAARDSSAQADAAGPAPSLGIGSMLAVALSLALITAFGELTLLAILRFGLHRTLRLGPDTVWMTPVALVAVFTPPTLLLVVLSRFWPRIGRTSVVVAALVLLMMINLILVERHLSIWALLIFSLGVAVQSGRLAEAHVAGFRRLVRISTPALLGLVLVSGVGVRLALAAREGREEDGLPSARPGAPNVLFIILDTMRARTLSLYGYARLTSPHLDSLGALGVVFDVGIAPGTWTVPSHASMFTGLWPDQLSAWWSDPLRRPPVETLAQEMARNGYRTGGFIGNWYHIGAESGMGTGFAHYDDLGHSLAQIARGSAMIRWLAEQRSVRHMIGLYETLGRRRAPDVSRAFVDWVGRDSTRPWFAFLNFFDVHSPALPPPPFDTRFGSSGAHREPVVIEELNRDVSPAPTVVQAERDAYDGATAYLDDQIAQLFAELDRRHALRNTVVIIGADHGEELGEHGRWGHAYSLYAEVVHVPLIVIAEGTPTGFHVTRPASLRDIAATIADLAGLEHASLPGRSLARFWEGEAQDESVDDPVYTSFGKYRSLYSDHYHYFVGVTDDREHLYDFERDPLEEHDLASDPVMAPILRRFRERMTDVAPPGIGRDALAVPPASE